MVYLLYSTPHHSPVDNRRKLAMEYGNEEEKTAGSTKYRIRMNDISSRRKSKRFLGEFQQNYTRLNLLCDSQTGASTRGKCIQLASNFTKGERIPPLIFVDYVKNSISALVPNLVNIVLHKCHQNYSHQMPDFSLKMHQIQFRQGLRLRLRWELTVLPRPPAGFGQGMRKGRRGRKQEWRRKEKWRE